MRRIARTLMAVVAVAIVVSGSATAAITLIDGFEDGDLSEYSSHADAGTSTIHVYAGSNSAFVNSGDPAGVGSTSGLPAYPERGDVYEYRLWHDSFAPTTSVSAFALQSEDNPMTANGYQVVVGGDDSDFELWLDDSSTVLASSSATIPQDEWMHVVVEWGNPTITVTLYNAAGSQIAQIQADDSTYDTGGVGMAVTGEGGANLAYWDNLTVDTGAVSTPTATATPTATPTDANQTSTPIVDGKQSPGEIWESFLVFVAFIILVFAAIGGLGSRSMAFGAVAAYPVLAYIAIQTQNTLLTNILYVTLTLIVIGMAFKMWRAEFGGQI